MKIYWGLTNDLTLTKLCNVLLISSIEKVIEAMVLA